MNMISQSQVHTSKNHQSGFTLIELMISIVLGLLIAAAAMSILISSQRGLMAQTAASDVQDDGLFGMDTLVNNIRNANYGAVATQNQSQYVMNDQTPQGGLVLTVPASATATTDVNMKGVMNSGGNKIAFVSASESGNSNLDGEKSDQLVIQWRTPKTTFDCEGNSVSADSYIVERYFLRVDTSAASTEPTALALACKSANYVYDADKVATNGMRLSNDLTGNGEILMSRVDQFRFLLGVNMANNLATDPASSMIRFMTVTQYNALTVSPKPRIMAVKLAVIARSASPTNVGADNADQRFRIFGDEEKLTTTVAAVSKYQRQLYERTVFIRNARG